MPLTEQTKDSLTASFLVRLNLDPTSENIKKYKFYWFAAPKSPTSMRLTLSGAKAMLKIGYTPWDVKLETSLYWTPKTINRLSKTLRGPFYLVSSNVIQLFEQTDTVVLALYGDNLNEWLEAADDQ